MEPRTRRTVLSLMIDGDAHPLDIIARRPGLQLSIAGRACTVDEYAARDDGAAVVIVDGREYQVWRAVEGDQIYLRINGRTHVVQYADPIAAAHAQGGGEDILRADMPGVVVSVDCETGQQVAQGDVLMVTESMKMQINIVAPRDGVVETIAVSPAATFDKGAELIRLEEAGS